jgi:hypothetical protein
VKIDDLIVQLARSAEPVTPLPAPSIRVAQWTASATALIVLAVLVIGTRADLSAAFTRPAFAASLAALLLATISSAAAAFVSSVPGAERSPLQRIVPIAAAVAWPAAWLTLIPANIDSNGTRVFHSGCAIEIAGLASVSGWALVAMLRRAAPLGPGWTAGMASLAAVTIASAATQVICPIDDRAHQLVGHVLVAAGVIVAASVIGRRLLASR